MTFRILFVLLSVVLAAPSFAADNNNPDVKGIYLLTDYPAVTVQPGTTSEVNLNLRNYGTAPERFALSVDGVPSGWTATLLGGGQPIAAAMPAADSSVTLNLRIDVPKDAAIGTKTITVKADANNAHVTLPLAVTLAKDLPAKLSLSPQLPALRGSSKSSFDYTLSIKNDSGKKLLVSLAAQAPPNFDTSFTEAYGTQELSSIPVDAGKSKDVKLKVKPPENADAGNYAVTAKVAAGDATATSALKLELTGAPDLAISGREGLLSARATAGHETSVPVVVTNNGTAPAENVKMSGSAPNGWKVTFQPETIAKIAPNQKQEVQALLTPPTKAIAGDYVTSLKAATSGNSESANFRVTVSTSTMWGIVGAGIIGAALLIMVGAVSRFGRR
ncbi:MAG TPA: NEW3 domain-containing protein [Pseudolabrys sp.]|jgi:uncharacterized repeat protein (TIGR01451 family)|nr:NEW3 domain-containing protein [Pseudolabrys sp.]